MWVPYWLQFGIELGMVIAFVVLPAVVIANARRS